MNNMSCVIGLLADGLQCGERCALNGEMEGTCHVLLLSLNQMAVFNCFCCLKGSINVLIVVAGFTALFLTCHVMYSESFVGVLCGKTRGIQHCATFKLLDTIWCVSKYSGG
jgi:hypothetical protein